MSMRNHSIALDFDSRASSEYAPCGFQKLGLEKAFGLLNTYRAIEKCRIEEKSKTID